MRSRPLLLLALLLPAGCATGPNAADRGFFGGIAAAMTGEDQANVARLGQAAATAETSAANAELRSRVAQREAERTGAQVVAARARLDRLQAELRRQQRDIASLRAQARTDGQRAEVLRLADEAAALERERAALAARGGGGAEVQRLEERSRALDARVRGFGAL